MDKVSPARELKNERVVLRHHRDELAETMFRYVDDDRERLGRFLPWPDYVRTVADEAKFIQDMHQAWDNGTQFDYGIFDAKRDEYMGNIGVHSISWEHEHCELGYWILGRFEGQGWMTESVRVLEAEMFRIGFNKVEIRCDIVNARSKSVPERLGYHLDGILRQDKQYQRGFVDNRVYSRLKSEWHPH